MRLKRQEYETLKSVVREHTRKLELIRIGKELEEYDLHYAEYIGDWIRILGTSQALPVVLISDFDKRFEGYKDGVEDGDIFIECDYDPSNVEGVYQCQHGTDSIKKKQPKKVLNSKKK